MNVYLKHFNETFYMIRYKYYFPFLDTKGEVIVEDNRVGPLYKHVFTPALSPGLSFIGLPWQVNDFYKCDWNMKWKTLYVNRLIS